jgi:hypothetical protein
MAQKQGHKDTPLRAQRGFLSMSIQDMVHPECTSKPPKSAPAHLVLLVHSYCTSTLGWTRSIERRSGGHVAWYSRRRCWFDLWTVQLIHPQV